MASKKKEHLSLLSSSDLHARGGCIENHGSTPKGSVCDYQKNGYDITQGRKSWYNDKLPRPDERRGILDVWKHVMLGTGNVSRFRKWSRYFKSARQRLLDDPKAWNVGYSCYPDLGENFLPKPHGGPGYWCPYIHNWHHLIPNAAPYNFIVGEDGSERGLWRLFLLLYTEYNLNCKENVVLLPNERFVGRVLGLPAHTPYGDCDHPQYTAACEARMTAIRNMLDSAIQDDECSIDFSKCKAAADAMNALSKDLLTIIRSMQPGQLLDDVTAQMLG